MVSLSVGVLQCNRLANVSTVAGKPALSSLSSSDSDLKLWRGDLRAANTLDPPIGSKQKPQNGQYTAPCCHGAVEPQVDSAVVGVREAIRHEAWAPL